MATILKIKSASAGRRTAVNDLKRALILDAARTVFERDGLEGASMRAIAEAAGYTAAAIYFHFKAKEDIYAALLDDSLDRLIAHIDAAVLACGNAPPDRLEAAMLAFHGFYAAAPRDMDLGFYLFRGGMHPAGLGRDRNARLNKKLSLALAPFRSACGDLGLDEAGVARETAAYFAQAAGLILLRQTGRLRLFKVDAAVLMRNYAGQMLARLTPPRPVRMRP